MIKKILARIAVALVVALMVGLLGWSVKWASSPTVYDFGNEAKLEVPWGYFSIDQRKDGNGVAVQSGVNVVVYNNSDEWRSLTVSYRKPNYGILDTHAFEDLPPKSSKTFGAPTKYEGMHISISDFAERKREKENKKS